MAIFFEDERIKVRQLRDCTDDYSMLTKWLSDLDVHEYYEGRSDSKSLVNWRILCLFYF
ncbi:hypothetical protein PRVXH_002175 [Proteinivorax hydrogeniformans]|uniref:Uncharacterized protein n=1 Tax=Proteinivorax hydrogeniformans TaxID=1826727 RepID=A0AAU8HRN3_9FIRM